VIKKDINPEWNEDLTLSVSDPSIPLMLVKEDNRRKNNVDILVLADAFECLMISDCV